MGYLAFGPRIDLHAPGRFRHLEQLALASRVGMGLYAPVYPRGPMVNDFLARIEFLSSSAPQSKAAIDCRSAYELLDSAKAKIASCGWTL